jgi:polyisoprenoid-binding protein YceI
VHSNRVEHHVQERFDLAREPTRAGPNGHRQWKVDEVHSSIHFGVRHLVVATLRGQFRRWTAELTMNENDLTASSVVITIDAASVDTGHTERDASLRSPRFFDAEQFPSLTFQSCRVERKGNDSYQLVGNLTIRGVTREIELDAQLGGFVTDLRDVRRAGFAARGSIQRADFGMVFNQVLETGGVAIGDRVDIFVEIEVVAVAAKAA